MTRITVLNIVSCSFTGTTWLNMVLGCHDRAFALGPADSLWNRRHGDLAGACQIHRDACDFWGSFAKSYDPSRNLYLQLAEKTGKNVFVINNPQDSRVELEHEDVEEKVVVLARDGRAVTASFQRKYPSQYSAEHNYYHVVRDWWTPAARNIAAKARASKTLLVRYEDVIDDLGKEVRRVGDFAGLEYDANVERYWEYPHHITGGSGGPIYLAARFQGIEHAGDSGNDSFYSHYREEFERLKSGQRFQDERWRQELGRRELCIFDHFAGEVNAELGYPRDEFAPNERAPFDAYLAQREGRRPDSGVTHRARNLLLLGLVAALGAAAVLATRL